MSDIQCTCKWNPDRHDDDCPVALKEQVAALKQQLEQGQARGCMQHDYLESLVSICTKQAKLLGSTVDPLVDLTKRFLRRGDIDSGPGKAWLLRKQAEAVEQAASLYVPKGLANTGIIDYATRLKQQADQLENTHD